MSKVRVGIFHSHPVDHEIPLFRALSGQENLDVNVFYFSAHGAQGTINTFGLKNIPYGNSPLEGYTYRILRNFGIGKSWNLYSFINPQIFRVVTKNNLDVVILYGYAYVSCWMVILAALLNRVAIIFRGEVESISPRPKWKLFLREAILPKLYRRIDGFLSLGLASEMHYRLNGVPDKCVIRVPQSIDQRFAQAKTDRMAISHIRLRYGFDENTVVFISIHKLRPEKRPLDVIRAFCQLDSALNTGLLMVSDGPLRKEAERYATTYNSKRRIHFTGYVTFEELVNLMYASDVLVAASEEPIGTVLFQALACGLALLASDMVLGWMDAIIPGENGSVFRSRSVESLVEHMHILAQNKSLVESMKIRSKELSKSFSLDKSVQGVLSAVERLGRADRP